MPWGRFGTAVSKEKPSDWLVPIEFVDLGEAYPEFLDFVDSGRTTNTDWYQRPGNNRTKPVNPTLWKW